MKNGIQITSQLLEFTDEDKDHALKEAGVEGSFKEVFDALMAKVEKGECSGDKLRAFKKAWEKHIGVMPGVIQGRGEDQDVKWVVEERWNLSDFANELLMMVWVRKVIMTILGGNQERDVMYGDGQNFVVRMVQSSPQMTHYEVSFEYGGREYSYTLDKNFRQIDYGEGTRNTPPHIVYSLTRLYKELREAEKPADS